MKLYKKIFYAISGVIFLLGILMIICMLNPDLTKEVAGFLYGDGRGGGITAAQPGEAGGLPRTQGRQEAEDGEEDAAMENAGGTENMEGPEEHEDQGSLSGNSGPGTGAAREGVSGNSAPGGVSGNGTGVQGESEQPEKYVQPEEENIRIPEDAGRNGYVPIQGKNTEVEEDEADRLREQVGYGELGEGLDFDTDFYPYYGMLDSTLKKLYRQIYANAEALNKTFVPAAAVRERQLRNVFEAVYNDHPELFWLDGGYTGKCLSGGQCVELTLKFNAAADDRGKAENELEAAASVILSGASGLGSDYDKEVYVHNALADKVLYRLNAPMNQSAYSALVNGESVCAGYARAFQYLLQELGIPCYYCTGYAGTDHAWNIVRLGGSYYNVDVTWDDADPTTYAYFNRTDSDYANSHIRRDMAVYLPACKGSEYRGLEREPLPQGLDPENIYTDLQGYYKNCYEQAMKLSGEQVITFVNGIQGSGLLQEWNEEYNSGAYAEGYVNQLLADIGASSCELNVWVEEAPGECYMLEHEIRILR